MINLFFSFSFGAGKYGDLKDSVLKIQDTRYRENYLDIFVQWILECKHIRIDMTQIFIIVVH